MRNYDRLKLTTTGTGTGNLTTTPETGYPNYTYLSDQFTYCIINEGNPAEWEIGYGGFYGSNVIQRITVHTSSNSNALVNFTSGSKSIMCVLTERNAVFSGYDKIGNDFGSPSIVGQASGVVGGAGASAADGVALGAGSKTYNGVALGYKANYTETYAYSNIVIGSLAGATSDDGIAIGNGAHCQYESVAIGKLAMADRDTYATTGAGIAIGNGANALALDSMNPIAIGDGTDSSNGGVSIGNKTKGFWPKAFTHAFVVDDGTLPRGHHAVLGDTVTTTNATATQIIDPAVASMYTSGSSNGVSAALFQVDIVGADSSGNVSAMRIVGAIKYGALIGTPVVTSVGKSSALSATACAATYSYPGLRVTVTGIAGTTIKWVAKLTMTWLDPRF